MGWKVRMRKLAAGAAVIVAAIVIGVQPVTPAHAAGDTRFGVNRVNLAWLSPAEREKLLDLMVKNGVVAVRLSLTKPIDQSIDAVRVAHAKGLAILLEISLNNPAFYPEGTQPRSGLGRIWDMYRLSDISPDQFRSVVGDALRKIDALKIPLVAVEAGNEINWGAYNGDLEVKAKAKSRTARSLADLDNLPAVEQGAARYVQLAAVVRKELQSTQYSRNAKVISAGLSDIPVADADRRGIDSIDPASFTNLMRKHGLDKVVDGYGIHIYPGSNGTAAARAAHVSQALSICRSEPDGKPCWITEWGFSNTATTCPANDGSREQLVEAARSRFAELMGTGRVAAAYYFDWDAKGYGVWRCGGLSPAGRAAVVTP